MPNSTPALLPVSKPFSAKLLVFAFLTAVTVFFQWNEGAYRSEFSGYPDEGGHYVTGLLVHDTFVFAKDYACSGFHGSLVSKGKEFVQNFYDHYPKIGLGQWPPLLYVIQSAWFVPFGSSRASVMLLIATLTGCVGTMLFTEIEAEFGAAYALAGCLLWLGMPPVQQYAGMLMAEILSALTMFAATLRLGRYLDGRRPKDAIAFGIFSAAALCTKGTGLALTFVALFAILLTRRFSVLKERAFWTGGVIAMVFGGPWVLLTCLIGRGGWEEPKPSWNFTRQALPFYGWQLIVVIGFVLATLAALGVACRAMAGFAPSAENPRAGKWASCLALIAGVVIFPSITPAGKEVRHLVPALGAVMLFAMAGIAWVARRSAVPALRTALPSIAVLVFFAAPLIHPETDHVYFGSAGDKAHLSPFKVRLKDSWGFRAVAARLMAETPKGKFLVSSDATGEGMFIAEVAMADRHRPNCIAKRASKELAQSAWNGSGYHPKYETEAAMLEYLTTNGFDFVVIDPAMPEHNRRPHNEMLARVLRTHPERFQALPTEPIFRCGTPMAEPLESYRVIR
ncbi:MAG: glycosyltransferase family 39 protein [Verrucomicrobiota bacterium]